MDYCIRLRRNLNAPLVSVPAARVLHPFWPRPLRQIAGWASGDVRCLDTLPTCGFRAPPNWAELSFATLMFAWVLPLLVSLKSVLRGTHHTNVAVHAQHEGFRGLFGVKLWWAAVTVLVEVLFLFSVNLQRVEGPTRAPAAASDLQKVPAAARLRMMDVLVSLLAVVPPMLQVRDTAERPSPSDTSRILEWS